MIEPQFVLFRAAFDALSGAGRGLRERGWPCEMVVDYVAARDTYAVSLRVELPVMRIPIEAKDEAE